MRHVHRADQVDFQYRLPVGRLELPERKAELARAGADGENDMVALTEALLDFLSRLANRGVLGHVSRKAERPREWADQIMDARIAINGRDMSTLGRKRFRDRRADSPRRPKDHHHVLGQTEIHNGSPRKSMCRSFGALAAGLLVAPADVDHPVANRSFGILGLVVLLGLANLLGGESATQ